MIVLTKEQKLEAYKFVLNLIVKRQVSFVCVGMSVWLRGIEGADMYNPLDYFPEFLSKKPEHKHISGGWWNQEEHSLRVKAVEEMIEEYSK